MFISIFLLYLNLKKDIEVQGFHYASWQWLITDQNQKNP